MCSVSLAILPYSVQFHTWTKKINCKTVKYADEIGKGSIKFGSTLVEMMGILKFLKDSRNSKSIKDYFSASLIHPCIQKSSKMCFSK